jgi:hypothetical protein
VSQKALFDSLVSEYLSASSFVITYSEESLILLTDLSYDLDLHHYHSLFSKLLPDKRRLAPGTFLLPSSLLPYSFGSRRTVYPFGVDCSDFNTPGPSLLGEQPRDYSKDVLPEHKHLEHYKIPRAYTLSYAIHQRLKNNLVTDTRSWRDYATPELALEALAVAVHENPTINPLPVLER